MGKTGSAKIKKESSLNISKKKPHVQYYVIYGVYMAEEIEGQVSDS